VQHAYVLRVADRVVEDPTDEARQVVDVDRVSLGDFLLIHLQHYLEQGLLVSERGIQPLFAGARSSSCVRRRTSG
jgi:hypothetical protein